MSVAATAAACPSCRHPVAADAWTCDLCGQLLRRASGAPVAPRAFPSPPPPPAPVRERGSMAGLPAPWSFLLLGALLAPLLAVAPFLRYVGWFFGSLCHELGHAATGWFVGCVSIPAIRLDGHAAAVHGAPSKLLAGLVALGLGFVLWRDRARPVRRIVWGVVLGVQLFLAATSAKEAAFLFAGHVGELAFATLFLARAVSGGFTETAAERALHAVVGFFLLGRNLWLSAGLIWSEATRDAYAGSGSFGLVNDYLRLAREVFGASIAVPATITGLLAVFVLPTALALGKRLDT